MGKEGKRYDLMIENGNERCYAMIHSKFHETRRLNNEI